VTAGWVRGVRLGVDVGSVRVGVAVCDPDGILATPVATLQRDHSLDDQIFAGPPPDAGGSPLETRSGRAERAAAADAAPTLKKRTKDRHKRGGPITASDGLPEAADGPPSATASHSDDQVGQATNTSIPSDVAKIARLAIDYGSVEVVIGLPVDLSGNEGPAAKKVREYARILAEAVAPIPIVMADERMSTVTAARRLSDRGVKGKRQRDVVDQAAAVEILQQYLESRRRQR
jgi:putative Holliday junction resolvase